MCGASKIEERGLNAEQQTSSHRVQFRLSNLYLFIYSAKHIGSPLGYQRGQTWAFHHSEPQSHIKWGKVKETALCLPCHCSLYVFLLSQAGLPAPERRTKVTKHRTRLLCSCVLPVTKAVLTVITSRLADIKHALHNVSHSWYRDGEPGPSVAVIHPSACIHCLRHGRWYQFVHLSLIHCCTVATNLSDHLRWQKPTELCPLGLQLTT